VCFRSALVRDLCRPEFSVFDGVQGSNATQMNNYSAGGSPAEGCKIIVKAALEKEGRTGVFIHKDGDYPW
jgi:hypothetical protein